MKKRMVVIYDGVHNGVFESQVVQPLIKQLNQNSDERRIIISFERKKISPQEQQRLITDPRITLIIQHKLPFFGSLSLHYAVRQLKPLLNQYTPHSITCRGPLSAWIVGHLKFPETTPCIVQARGLAAQEYRYTHPSWPHRIRANQYEQVEQWVYGAYSKNENVTVQTVSNALKQYLIEAFNAPPEKIEVTDHDVPTVIPAAQCVTWRTEIREQLCIPLSAYVFVYNGSAKPWQCPEQTVQFFVRQHEKNSDTFLLVLTQDINTFKTLLARHNLPSNSYHITSVPHTDIYRYLAAADAGILLREAHILNWVSRPTKALEYRAVGLKIIHNNTVRMLVDDTRPFDTLRANGGGE